MISKELLLFIETDFSLIVKGSKISDMLVSITFNQLYLHFGKGKSILFEYAFKPIQTRCETNYSNLVYLTLFHANDMWEYFYWYDY